jgi:hypothetical protein
MKFIKLFEAFESTLLSKTLNYVKGESKQKFLDGVKAICDKYDFPENKLNDSFFEYLPYSKALNYRLEKGRKGDQVDCKAKSVDVFGDKGIADGECRAGKLPKKWGTGSRRVECPTCKGTGKIGEPDGDDKLLPQDVYKFWFDETGKYVTTTYNYVKGDEVVKNNEKVIKYWCYNGDYLRDKGSQYEFTNLRDVPHLTPCTMYFDIREWNNQRGTPGFLWGNRYFIHNRNSKYGSSPDGHDWKNYGNYSWSVGGGDSFLLITREVEKSKSTLINFERSRVNGKMSIKQERTDNIKKSLSDAKFAIVLDINKLQSTEFIKKSDIIKTRTDVKKDVIGGEFGIKDVDIKKQNIDRYISKLSDVSGDKLDIGNFDTYFFRILGFKNILFKIINVGSDPRYRISKSLEDILNLNIKLVKAINKAKAKRGEYVEPKDEVALLSNSLKSYFKREMDVNRKNIDHLKAVESRCDEKHLVLLRSVEEISNVIYQKLKSLGKLESVDDAEILVEKIKTIENLIWNKRYEWSNFRINSISAIPGVPLATKNPDEIKRICNALKNVIEKV